MSEYVSMLRGINVGGQKKVGMEELRRLYESLGFRNVRTYVQSGNVIFESPEADAEGLVRRIEGKVRESLGFDVSVLIRTRDEIQRVIEGNPFAAKDVSKLHVTFLREVPVSVSLEEIEKASDRAEDFLVSGREIYLFCPNGYGGTRLSNAFFERKLKVLATTRNWRTVNAFLSNQRNEGLAR